MSVNELRQRFEALDFLEDEGSDGSRFIVRRVRRFAPFELVWPFNDILALTRRLTRGASTD